MGNQNSNEAQSSQNGRSSSKGESATWEEIVNEVKVKGLSRSNSGEFIQSIHEEHRGDTQSSVPVKDDGKEDNETWDDFVTSVRLEVAKSFSRSPSIGEIKVNQENSDVDNKTYGESQTTNKGASVPVKDEGEEDNETWDDFITLVRLEVEKSFSRSPSIGEIKVKQEEEVSDVDNKTYGESQTTNKGEMSETLEVSSMPFLEGITNFEDKYPIHLESAKLVQEEPSLEANDRSIRGDATSEGVLTLEPETTSIHGMSHESSIPTTLNGDQVSKSTDERDAADSGLKDSEPVIDVNQEGAENNGLKYSSLNFDVDKKDAKDNNLKDPTRNIDVSEKDTEDHGLDSHTQEAGNDGRNNHEPDNDSATSKDAMSMFESDKDSKENRHNKMRSTLQSFSLEELPRDKLSDKLEVPLPKNPKRLKHVNKSRSLKEMMGSFRQRARIRPGSLMFTCGSFGSKDDPPD